MSYPRDCTACDSWEQGEYENWGGHICLECTEFHDPDLSCLPAHHKCGRLLAVVMDRLTERNEARAQLGRVQALFAAGPDTPCRTHWIEGVEHVAVPMVDLRTALDGPRVGEVEK